MTDSPAVISFVAPSGTGKTTYVEMLIPLLVDRGLRVAAVKHDAHRFQMDREGKDTARLRAAGSTRVAIANDHEVAVYGDANEVRTLADVIRLLGPVDVVVVEGYRTAEIPKVVVARAAAPRAPYDATAEDVVAVVSDFVLPGGRPHFPLDDPAQLVEFLVTLFSL